MSGKRSRTKGAAWERDVAEMLRKVLDDDSIRRGLQSQGGVVADVVCPVFWPECKVGAAPPLWRGLAQAKRDMPEGQGRMPVVIAKRHTSTGDRKPTRVAVMDLEDWLELVQEWWELKNEDFH